jgi:hypothetical protein
MEDKVGLSTTGLLARMDGGSPVFVQAQFSKREIFFHSTYLR